MCLFSDNRNSLPGSEVSTAVSIQSCRREYSNTTFVEAVLTLSRCNSQVDGEQKFGTSRIQVDWQIQFASAMFSRANPEIEQKNISKLTMDLMVRGGDEEIDEIFNKYIIYELHDMKEN